MTESVSPNTLSIQNLNSIRNYPSNLSANMITINSTIINAADLNGAKKVTLNFDYISTLTYDKSAK